MGKAKRISVNTLGVIVGLVVSVGLSISGLKEGLAAALDPVSANVVYILTLVSLILIPICSRENRWGFLSAMVLGIVLLALSVSDFTQLITGLPSAESPEFESTVGGMIWGIIQIPIIVFSYRAYREGTQPEAGVRR